MDQQGPPESERAARLLLYAGIGLIVLGIIVVYLGYNGAATHTSIVQQFPYLVSGGIAGLSFVLLGAAITVGYLVRDAQSQMREQIEELRTGLQELTEVMSRSAFSGVHGAPEEYTNGHRIVLTLRSGSSFHREGCRLVDDKEGVKPLPKDEAERQGLLACRICKP